MAAGGGHTFRLVNVIHHKDHPTELIFRPIYWARYVDWVITTPLILVDLTVLAGLPGAEILLAVFADVAMILFVLPYLGSNLTNRDCLLLSHIERRNGAITLFLA